MSCPERPVCLVSGCWCPPQEEPEETIMNGNLTGNASFGNMSDIMIFDDEDDGLAEPIYAAVILDFLKVNLKKINYTYSIFVLLTNSAFQVKWFNRR